MKYDLRAEGYRSRFTETGLKRMGAQRSRFTLKEHRRSTWGTIYKTYEVIEISMRTPNSLRLELSVRENMVDGPGENGVHHGAVFVDDSHKLEADLEDCAGLWV